MKKGFTLIELLVVIAIVGLLTVMSTAVIISARQKRQAKAVAEQVKNVIIEAHAYAIAPKAASTGDQVDINIGHAIEAKVAGDDVVHPITVASNIKLSCTIPDPCLSFIIGMPGGGDSNQIGQLTDATKSSVITAENRSTGETYKITVSPLSGNVTIKAEP